MNHKRANIAVSEILGGIILLGIATSSFSILNYYVISAPTPNPPPIVEISGSIRDNHILLMHRGGEPLSLDTELLISLGEKPKKMRVGDFLDADSKADGLWSLGEEIVYPVVYDFDYESFPGADIVIVDQKSGSVIMTGNVEVDPVCDISVKIEVDNQFPGMKTNILITITATNEGNINSSAVAIKFELPEELTHYDNSTTQGVYTNSSGIWELGMLAPNQSAVLDIEVILGERGSLDDTQLVLLLDGSGSIAPGDWTLQVEGLGAAVENEETFPHDGTVELTVIQFGGGYWGDEYNPPEPGFAKVEIGPVLIKQGNYISIADDIRNLPQIGSMTPTACSIYMGADTVFKSSVFDPDIRQIILMVTDGNPTQGCDCDGDYQADDWFSGNYRVSAEVARDYLINKLGMTIDQDEFDAIAVGESASHASWLKNSIVWPKPGYYAPPFLIGTPNRGWVRNVTTWQEFAETIDESFGIIFNKIITTVEVSSVSLTDPKLANDLDTITIIPMVSPTVITKAANDINDKNATLNMYYNFKWIGSGELRFAYKTAGGSGSQNWYYTPWEAYSNSGYYAKKVLGLTNNTLYIFRGELKYYSPVNGITILYVIGQTFTTLPVAIPVP